MDSKHTTYRHRIMAAVFYVYCLLYIGSELKYTAPNSASALASSYAIIISVATKQKGQGSVSLMTTTKPQKQRTLNAVK